MKIPVKLLVSCFLLSMAIAPCYAKRIASLSFESDFKVMLGTQTKAFDIRKNEADKNININLNYLTERGNFLPLKITKGAKTTSYLLTDFDWCTLDVLKVLRPDKGSGIALVINSDETFDWIQCLSNGTGLTLMSINNQSDKEVKIKDITVAKKTMIKFKTPITLSLVKQNFDADIQLTYDGRDYALADMAWCIVDVLKAYVPASSGAVGETIKVTSKDGVKFDHVNL